MNGLVLYTKRPKEPLCYLRLSRLREACNPAGRGIPGQLCWFPDLRLPPSRTEKEILLFINQSVCSTLSLAAQMDTDKLEFFSIKMC